MAPLLEITDLNVVFQTRRKALKAIDNLSVTMEPGEILGFVGESGAGKSVTGAAIMGLIDPPGYIASGEIKLKGRPVADYGTNLRGKEVGMIFQDPLTSLNPLRTVGDQLAETIQHNLDLSLTEARNKAVAGLSEVGIDPDRFNSYPHEFSGGMRQRVVIALALAAEPDLIIADEPTTALDVSIQAQVLDLLRAVCQKRRASVILITHDMGVISQTTDRVAVLYAGRMMEIGTTSDVIKQPRHPYTKGLIASTPVLDHVSADSTLPQIPGAMPSLDALPPGCRFHPRCGDCKPQCRTTTPIFENDIACHLFMGASA
ncbi:ABC transporter ATP-binding protein [Candidatus Puniceispirillum sp.]|uniref:ABC transporter ATP-binding protein n=1 Tax=Candidatus Puniceispirillum sp. TaxID=2026719 RepID=UPI003F6A0DE0